MDDKDWLMLQYIHKERNFTKAAEQLYMTQPALSYRLSQLEKEFGVPLIIKSGKVFRFTPEGEHLVAYAKNMLAELRKTTDFIVNMRSEVQGSLHIGASIYYGQYELPQKLQQFLEMYPHVEVRVDTGFSTEIIQALMQEEIQIGIVRGDYEWLDQKLLLGEEQISLISKTAIDPERLPCLPRINYRAPKLAVKAVRHTSTSLDESISAWWYERYQQPPLITMQVDSFETCKEMVRHGLGYAIIPSSFVRPSDQLHKLDLMLKNGEPITRKTWLLYRETAMQFTAVQKFVQLLQADKEQEAITEGP
ncbi:LysR family transcriptional regulator [Brevibacillus fluminis]|uniref:LysR family transcriptional regulator n=1 Tax=Brevibacillus fluminis TaxID=511487 RepID=A0A3M8DID0_9BACL|nr:LysR family transcriptional regulator [Brevibacillus fluminis]RNB87862.1 LysR family transcriptional regulator [Brevibacillus fluminis]